MSAKYVEANEIRNHGPVYNTWPASLPQVSYVVADSAFLCVSCANEHADLQDSDQWRIIGAQVNEDPTECAHCYRTILGKPHTHVDSKGNRS